MSRAAELAKFIGDGTLGLGGAEDKKLVFDGNAQDFHIGLDDSADSLTIGLGSTLGTTSHMVFDANGHITKPLQPAFLVRPTSSQTNLAVGSDVTIVFGTEIFDQNADFASNTFTAPVTGKYQLNVGIYFEQIVDNASYITIRLKTSNRTFYAIYEPEQGNDNQYKSLHISVLADMDANDTAYVDFYQPNNTQQADVATASEFSGFLAC